jgi:hypothetical protein
VQGKRVYNFEPQQMQPGDYGKWGDGWWVYPPMKDSWGGCSIAKHTVVEHADGTITVTPSILVTDGLSKVTWHGFLTAGNWQEC